jgi:hypothetical protein
MGFQNAKAPFSFALATDPQPVSGHRFDRNLRRKRKEKDRCYGTTHCEHEHQNLTANGVGSGSLSRLNGLAKWAFSGET